MYKGLGRIQTFVENIHEIVDSTEKAKIAEDTRIILQELYLEFVQRYAIKVKTFQTVAPVATTTQTLTATNGTKTVTASAPYFTAAMVGRKIQSSRDPRSYKVDAFASSTSITIDENYEGTTGGGKSGTVFQDEYDLGGGVDKVVAMNWSGLQPPSGRIYEMRPHEFFENWPFALASDQGTPTIFTRLQPSETFPDVGANVASGTDGNDFLIAPTGDFSDLGIAEFDLVTANNKAYIIKGVNADDDTQLDLWEAVEGSFSSLAYVITQRRQRVRLHPVPNEARSVVYSYYEYARPVGVSKHIPWLFYNYFEALEWGAAFMALYRINDLERAQIAASKFEKWIKLAERNEHVMPSEEMVQQSFGDADRRTGREADGMPRIIGSLE